MKRLGWILALCLGGSGLYYATTDHSATNAATQQPSAIQQQSAPTQPAAQQEPAAQQQSAPTQPTSTTLSNDNHYTNSRGNVVHSPARSSEGGPPGATAACGDGSYS